MRLYFIQSVFGGAVEGLGALVGHEGGYGVEGASLDEGGQGAFVVLADDGVP